jgi:SWI/SNF-related matrix-associated actin-dependent regulator of chromatin subfamily A3
LQFHGLRYDVIHGGLALTKRLKVLGEFKSPTGPNILLMTLGTGAVGLVASFHLYSHFIADVFVQRLA